MAYSYRSDLQINLHLNMIRERHRSLIDLLFPLFVRLSNHHQQPHHSPKGINEDLLASTRGRCKRPNSRHIRERVQKGECVDKMTLGLSGANEVSRLGDKKNVFIQTVTRQLFMYVCYTLRWGYYGTCIVFIQEWINRWMQLIKRRKGRRRAVYLC